MSYRLLILNPGSTSTKAAVYEDDRPVCMHQHRPHQPGPGPLPRPAPTSWTTGWPWCGAGWRQESFDLSTLSAVVGRGGIIPNIVAGGYRGGRQPGGLPAQPHRSLTTPPTWAG